MKTNMGRDLIPLDTHSNDEWQRLANASLERSRARRAAEPSRRARRWGTVAAGVLVFLAAFAATLAAIAYVLTEQVLAPGW